MVKCGTKNDSLFCKIPTIAYKLRVGEISNESNYKLLYISFCRHCIWARQPLHSHFLGTRGENRLSCLHNRQSLLCRNQQNLPVKTKIGHFLQLSFFPFHFIPVSLIFFLLLLSSYTVSHFASALLLMTTDSNWRTRRKSRVFSLRPPPAPTELIASKIRLVGSRQHFAQNFRSSLN